jgi:hypothetical protein
MKNLTARHAHVDYEAYALPRATPWKAGRRLLRTILTYLPHTLVALMLVGLLVTASLGPVPQPTPPLSHLGMHQ